MQKKVLNSYQMNFTLLSENRKKKQTIHLPFVECQFILFIEIQHNYKNITDVIQCLYNIEQFSTDKKNLFACTQIQYTQFHILSRPLNRG